MLLFFSYFILNKVEFHRILQQILTNRRTNIYRCQCK